MKKNETRNWKNKTILLLGSGSPRRRFVFDVAKKLGIKTVVFSNQVKWSKRLADDFVVVDMQNHAEVMDTLRHYMAKHHIDGVTTFQEEYVDLLGKICEEFNFIGNSRQTSKLLRNKYSMRQQFAASQISQPAFALINSQADLHAAIKKIGLPGVIKPVAGASGFFVIEIHSEEEAKEAFDYIKKNTNAKFDPVFNFNQYQFLYEAYIDGPEVGVECVTQNGQTNIIAIFDKHTSNEPYFIDESEGMPSKFDQETIERIERTVFAVHQTLGVMNGLTHTELCITKEGPEVVEIDGRLANNFIWDGVKTVWGVDLVEQAFRVALGLPITVYGRSVEPKKYWECRHLTAPESGVVSAVHGVDEAEDMSGVRDVYIDKEVGDTVLKPPSGFETMGWIAADGDSHSEAEENAKLAIEKITTQVIPFDPDSSIGQTERKDKYSFAFVARKKLLAQARLEKLRHLDIKDIRKLHVGVLGNVYKDYNKTQEAGSVANELMSVGFGIQKTLQDRGYQVTFFDMNENPLPIDKIQKSGVDIIFNVCERLNDSSLLEPHGAALMDILQIPYTGSNPLTLAFCIDKIKVKKLLAYHNIPTARFDTIYSMNEVVDEELRYPLIVKPANTDNSIGITNKSVVTNKQELKKQLEEVIVKAGRPALVEEYIEGDEFDVSIIGNGTNLKVLPLTRSTFDKMPKGYWHIYAFESKFSDDSVYDKIRTERPAKVLDKLAKLITEISIDTYNILGAHDYARIELRVDKDNNPYVIELNPNPSIGNDAGTAKCAQLVGYDYGDFIELLLSSAVTRYKNKAPFTHLTV